MPKTIHRPENDVVRAMLRSLRESAGITQTDLSSRLGRSQSFISDIERGVRRIDVLELRDICQLAGKDFSAFIRELEAAIAALPAKRKDRLAPNRTRAPRRKTRAS